MSEPSTLATATVAVGGAVMMDVYRKVDAWDSSADGLSLRTLDLVTRSSWGSPEACSEQLATGRAEKLMLKTFAISQGWNFAPQILQRTNHGVAPRQGAASVILRRHGTTGGSVVDLAVKPEL